MERRVNTTSSIRGQLMPESPPEDAPDMTQTNGSPAAIDEEGEFDDSPAIRSLSVILHHPVGAPQMQTDIRVEVYMPHGWQSKRMVLTGGITVKRLVEQLKTVQSW